MTTASASEKIVNRLKSFFAYKLDEDQKKLADALEKSEVTSRKVVGRGGLTMDGNELLQTVRFQAYRKRGAEVVNANKVKIK